MLLQENVTMSDENTLFFFRRKSSFCLFLKIDFENERSDQCRIDFSRKKEITASTSRRVRRVLVDSTLPSVCFSFYFIIDSHSFLSRHGKILMQIVFVFLSHRHRMNLKMFVNDLMRLCLEDILELLKSNEFKTNVGINR